MSKHEATPDAYDLRAKHDDAQARVYIAGHRANAWIWGSFWLGFFGLASSFVWVCGR